MDYLVENQVKDPFNEFILSNCLAFHESLLCRKSEHYIEVLRYDVFPYL